MCPAVWNALRVEDFVEERAEPYRPSNASIDVQGLAAIVHAVEAFGVKFLCVFQPHRGLVVFV